MGIEETSLKEEIIRMVSEGNTVADVVRILNDEHPELKLDYKQAYHVARGHIKVRKDITKARLFMPDGRRRRDAIMELYDRGVKPVDVAKQLDLDHKKVLDEIHRVRQQRLVEEARKQYARQILQS